MKCDVMQMTLCKIEEITISILIRVLVSEQGTPQAGTCPIDGIPSWANRRRCESSRPSPSRRRSHPSSSRTCTAAASSPDSCDKQKNTTSIELPIRKLKKEAHLVASSIANWSPMHLRAPAPNGMNAKSLVTSLGYKPLIKSGLYPAQSFTPGF